MKNINLNKNICNDLTTKELIFILENFKSNIDLWTDSDINGVMVKLQEALEINTIDKLITILKN